MAIRSPESPQSMVGWYDPPQLLRTGALVAVSQHFALHADNREIQAIANPGLGASHYTTQKTKEPFWIDFVADCGDGWNSTYAVASALAQDHLSFVDSDAQVDTVRGQVLVFGGDLVYPTPSGIAYEHRLLNPYRDAFRTSVVAGPDVWALPGNHDWYDSLVCFRNLFCTGEKFSGWQTRQKLSYFAFKLPYGWWLFGVDFQLQHDIDHRQFEYFKRILEEVGENEQIILCCAEPYWVERPVTPNKTSDDIIGPFQKLIENAGKKIRVSIAGDLHYYQRQTSADGRHLITCGTGGAFLHPTHANLSTECSDGFEIEKSYPSVEESKRLTYRNLLFPFINPLFGLAPALFYLLVAWATSINIGESFAEVHLKELGRLGISQFGEALHVGLHSAILSPTGIGLYAVIFAGFIMFTNTKSQIFRWVAGIAHSFSHVLAGFLIFWFASYVCIHVLGLIPKSVEQYFIATLIILPLAWFFSSIIMGIYLLISSNVFGQHETESFSSLRIQDWKGFLRMRISSDGKITFYFIGIRDVPRNWKSASDERSLSKWQPADVKAGAMTLEDQFEVWPNPKER
jgi:hypothetical protein